MFGKWFASEFLHATHCQGQQARGSNCDVSPDIATHSHEEANTLIPLHVLDSLRTNTMRQIDVHCGDTDGLLAPDRSCYQ